MARKLFKLRKRDVAALKIQKNIRQRLARKEYFNVKVCAIQLQTGIRAMASHQLFRHKKKSKEAAPAQVIIQLPVI